MSVDTGIPESVAPESGDEGMGASLRDRAVVNGAGQAVSALRASVPSARRMEGSYKRRQREAVLDRDGPECHYCGVETVPPRFSNDPRGLVRTVDHLVPYSRGGTNAVSNLVIACLACNQAKADRAFAAQAMSAREGQDPQGLGAKPASAVPQGCAQPEQKS